MTAIQAFEHSSSQIRMRAARDFLATFPADAERILVGAKRQAVDDFARILSKEAPATFGLHRFSFLGLVSRCARGALAESGRAPASVLGVEAIAARAVFETHRLEELGRFEAVRQCPGFARAVSQSVADLRLAALSPAHVQKQLGGQDLSALGAGKRSGHLVLGTR